MPYIFAVIISSNKGTLRDLYEYYYLDDCLDILDVIHTDRYNENIIIDNAERSKK